MTSAYRITVIITALAAIMLASYDLASPFRFGMLGFDYSPVQGVGERMLAIYPGSGAAKAGLQPGDVIRTVDMTSREWHGWTARRAGDTVTFPVERNGSVTRVSIVSTPYNRARPIEEGPAAFVIILCFATTAILIAFRGGTGDEVRYLAMLLSLYPLARAVQWLQSVAPSESITTCAVALQAVLITSAMAYCLLRFVTIFPPVESKLRKAIGHATVPFVVLLSAAGVTYALGTMLPRATFALVINGQLWPDWLHTFCLATAYALFIAGALDGMLHAGAAHRVQVRWAGTAIVVSSLPQLGRLLYHLLSGNPNSLPFDNWITLIADIPLLAIVYAVLRHRLVDIGVIVSRAAIFTGVSLSIVSLFVIAEWAGGKMLEGWLGESARQGAAGQALLAGLALALGLSTRSIHAFVERHLNRIFFAKRAKANAELRRFASETDVITETQSLFELAYEAIEANSEGSYTALYVLDNGSYRAVHTSEELPQALAINDSAVVRLRRWSEPFEMDRGAHPLAEALLLPMSVRGSLLGIVCCGPKRERTRYLAEEVDILALVAHRIGTAYEFLSRDRAPVRAALVPVT